MDVERIRASNAKSKCRDSREQRIEEIEKKQSPGSTEDQLIDTSEVGVEENKVDTIANNDGLCRMGESAVSPAAVNQILTPVCQLPEVSTVLDSSDVGVPAAGLADSSIFSSSSQDQSTVTLSSLEITQENSKSDLDTFGLAELFDNCSHAQKTVISTSVEKKKGKMRPGKREREKLRKRKLEDGKEECMDMKTKKKQKSEIKSKEIEKTEKDEVRSPRDEEVEALVCTQESSSKTGKRLSKKERKRAKKRQMECTKENSKEETDDMKEKPRKVTPNHFLAIRVSDPAIHNTVKVIQDSIANHNAKLQPALIPIGTLHITLMVMHLEKEDVEKAITALENCRSDLVPYLVEKSLTMTFEGLNHFKHEVLFANIKEEEEIKTLEAITDVVKESYAKEGILSTDDRAFQPHLTLMKLSRMQTKQKKALKKIPQECYATWMETEFGVQPVNQVFLCSMIHAKQKDGFYHCVECLDFGESDGDKQGPNLGLTEDSEKPFEIVKDQVMEESSIDNPLYVVEIDQNKVSCEITEGEKSVEEEVAACEEVLGQFAVVDEHKMDVTKDARASGVTRM